MSLSLNAAPSRRCSLTYTSDLHGSQPVVIEPFNQQPTTNKMKKVKTIKYAIYLSLIAAGSLIMAACDSGSDSSLPETGGQYRLNNVNVLIGNPSLSGFEDGEVIKLNTASVTIGEEIYEKTDDPLLQATYEQALAEVQGEILKDDLVGLQSFIYGTGVGDFVIFAYAFEKDSKGGQIRYSKNGGLEVATATFDLSN